MKSRLLCRLAVASWLIVLPVREVYAQLVVVVNARSGVAVMTKNEVMNIFLGRYRQFFNGVAAQPADMVDNNPERMRFYQALVGKDLAEINAHWARLVFSGRIQPPPQLDGADEVLKWVVSHPGGIGFVDVGKVDARVKVVFEFSP